MISLHMHAWSILRAFLDTYDIIMTERFDAQKARLGKGRACLIVTLRIRLLVMFNNTGLCRALDPGDLRGPFVERRIFNGTRP